MKKLLLLFLLLFSPLTVKAVKRIKPKNLTFTVLKSMSVRNAKSVREK